MKSEEADDTLCWLYDNALSPNTDVDCDRLHSFNSLLFDLQIEMVTVSSTWRFPGLIFSSVPNFCLELTIKTYWLLHCFQFKIHKDIFSINTWLFLSLNDLYFEILLVVLKKIHDTQMTLD